MSYVLKCSMPPDYQIILSHLTRNDDTALQEFADKMLEHCHGRPMRGELFWGSLDDQEVLHIATMDCYFDCPRTQMEVHWLHRAGYTRTPVVAPVKQDTPPVARRMNFRKR